MSDERARDITRILNEAPDRAVEELLPLVYAELRAMARRQMRGERPGQTLQATALVHEAFLRLVGSAATFENRRHFFAAAAQAMRRILVEQARRKSRIRHGGLYRRTTAPMEDISLEGDDLPGMIDLDRALSRLEQLDKGMADVVSLRYFAGLDVEETARALGISPRGVNRHWTAARAWLTRELGESGDGGD